MPEIPTSVAAVATMRVSTPAASVTLPAGGISVGAIAWLPMALMLRPTGHFNPHLLSQASRMCSRNVTRLRTRVASQAPEWMAHRFVVFVQERLDGRAVAVVVGELA